MAAQPDRDRDQGEIVPFSAACAPEGSEDALAVQFAAAQDGRVRYVPTLSRWYVWTGRVWREDTTLQVYDSIRPFLRSAAEDVVARKDQGADRIARDLTRASTVSAVEKLARADRRIAASIDIWDRDTMVLATPDGTVDLSTGVMRPSRPDDFCTRLTSCGPAARGVDAPVWNRFLGRITAGDDDFMDYLQRIAGYILTGETREHCLFFVHGPGRNGKSVFLNTLAHILGDHARTADMATFTETHAERHSTELATLRGARLVIASETERNRNWAEARIKQLTGGDPVTARFMRQDPFTYLPQFKLAFMGNHLPGLRGVDEAMRARVRIVPFTVVIPHEERDKRLLDKLRAEAPAIFRWAIEGCLSWQEKGLAPSGRVADATAAYFRQEDRFALWLAECCMFDPHAVEGSTTLYHSWSAWCLQRGEVPGSQKALSQELERRGFLATRLSGGATAKRGLRLLATAASEELGKA